MANKKAALYLRVSVDSQTVQNQRRELEAVAERMGWDVVAVYSDEGISGSKGRDKRPGFDALWKAITRREIDIVAVWAVDRIGRSLPDLVSFLGDVQAKGVDLYIHQQGVDTTTPSGRMLFQMMGVFAEYERCLIRARVISGLERTRAKGTRLGRPPVPNKIVTAIKAALAEGHGVRETARRTGSSPATVSRISQTMAVNDSETLSVAIPA